MPKYFRYFPEITYQKRQVKNITRRVRFLESVATDPRVFLPYVIKDGENVDEISYHYYGTTDYVWLVYLANNIIDPYYDWPMSTANMDPFIADKYRDVAEKDESRSLSDREVIQWTQNASITSNIAYYTNRDDPDVKLSTDSYGIGLDPDFQAEDWDPLRYYDYEFLQNEDKRHIFLIDRAFATQTEAELKSLINV